MNETIYREADLNYIFVRAKLPNESWGSLSLNELSDEQFTSWLMEKFAPFINLPDNDKWTPKKKVDVLNHISKSIYKPCVIMIKREARHEWDKRKDSIWK